MPDKKYITQNVTSYHLNRKKNRNENNYGVGYEEKDGDYSKMLGGYRNSFDKNSLYALAGYTPYHLGNSDLGVFGGLVSGYAKTPIPALGLLWQYQNGDYGTNVSVVPPVKINGRKMDGFVGWQLKKLLK